MPDAQNIDSLLFALNANGRWFDSKTFHKLFIEGWIVDGRDGGLVVGRRHIGGNIYMITQDKQAADRFHFHHHMEGGEYILNHTASSKHMTSLVALNADVPPADDEIASVQLSKVTRILNVHASPFDKLLLIDNRGQFIVNRRATHKNLAVLEILNDGTSDFRHCDPTSMVPRAPSQ